MNKILIVKYLLLTIIIIIASFLRLYNIAELPPGLYPDEAMNGNNALEALSPDGHFKWFYPENNGREGLFINIQALSIYIFGNEPWALRGVSAIFGILTVLSIYLLTKELFSYEITKLYENTKIKIALLSSFFLAVSFWHINFSRIGFRAIMAPFFITFALYFLFRALNKNYSLGSGMLAGLFFGLGFHSYIAFRGLPILILIIFAIDWFKNPSRRKSLVKIFIWAAAIFLIAFAPLSYYFIENPKDFMGRTAQVSIFSSPAPLKDLTLNIIKTAGMFNFSGDYNWRHNYASKPELLLPVGILFLTGIILGIIKFFTNNSNEKKLFGILFAWLSAAALPVVVSNEGLPHALRAILMAPAIFILAGFGGVWIYNLIKNLAIINDSKIKLIILNVSAAIFLTFLIFEAYHTYFIKWGKGEHTAGAFNQNYVDIGRELNALPKELPKYVVVETGGVLVRGIPMPAQTVMFITDTFTPEKQKEKNIYYVLPEQKNQIPENGYTVIIK
ncbi:MAG: glycosyltransferase family 39 protein [Patescibacteria group bacterium]